jgi:glycosyltransferase involved in cell wall biosynthesis
MSPRPLWYIVTPVYKPAPGGGAIYTDILARALAAEGADVVVATEAFTGQPPREELATGRGSVTIERIFPMRAGRAERDWRSYLAYAVQNLRLLGLPRRMAGAARRTGATSVTVLIHSSLFYNRGVMPWLLERFRQSLPRRARLVVDVRDPKVSEQLLPTLARADAVIGCSRAIADGLREKLPDTVDVVHLPIPFEPPEAPDRDEVERVLRAHDLEGIPYVFNPNGVNKQKRYPAMLELVRALRRVPGYERAALVTIGRARDWTSRDDAASAEGLLRYLGVVPNSTALALAGGALATAILSRIEGMPRSGLETLAIGKPLLAPDIPEFREFIPSSIVRSDTPEDMASQVLQLAGAPPGERYPLERHEMSALVSSYRALEADAAAAANREVGE